MFDRIVRRWPLLVTIGAICIFDGLSVFPLRALANPSIHWAVLGAVVFRIRGWQRLTVALFSLWLIGIGLAVATIYVAGYWNGNRPILRLDVVPIMDFAGALVAIFLIGLTTFRISGYSLGERRKKPVEAFTNATPPNPSLGPATKKARALAGGFLVIAAVANVPVARFELARRQQDQALYKLTRQAAANGGSVEVLNHQLNSLTAWPEMNDADLHVIDLSTVHTLSLAGSQVTDAILPELNTPRLISLDLSRTQISEQALALCNKTHLHQLKLSAPQFTGKCFANWTFRVTELDLSNSGVTDDTLAFVKRLMPMESLDLSNTAVTDSGLELLAGMRLDQLNLSGTRITAECIRALKLADKIIISPGQFSSSEQLSLEASGAKVQGK